MALRSIELFAGGGGLALGLERAGVRTVCFVERDAFAAATLVRQMEEGGLAPCPVWTDVSTFDGRPWRGVVDLVAGGFPCQDISNAGKREGIDGERSGLWSQFARIVGEVRPRFVFVENVAALAARGLDRVLGDLAALGFDAEWCCLGADDAGAPHGRERMFILADAGRDERAPERTAEGGAERDEARGQPAPRLRRVADVADRCGCWDPDAWHRKYGMRPGEVGRNARRLANSVRDGLEGLDSARAEARAVVGGGGAPMAHATHECMSLESRSDGRGEPMDRSVTRASGGDGVRSSASRIHDGGRNPGVLPWPPAPDDADGWRRYLDSWPGTEPAVRRGADGLARRVDRLRLLGNGVVPDQAELAVRVLWARLHGGT